MRPPPNFLNYSLLTDCSRELADLLGLTEDILEAIGSKVSRNIPHVIVY